MSENSTSIERSDKNIGKSLIRLDASTVISQHVQNNLHNYFDDVDTYYGMPALRIGYN